MEELRHTFQTEGFTLLFDQPENYRTRVQLFADRAVIHRAGRKDNLPPVTEIPFSQVSGVYTGHFDRRNWITFAPQNWERPAWDTFDSLPFHDPWTIMFDTGASAEARREYDLTRAIYQQYRRDRTVSTGPA